MSVMDILSLARPQRLAPQFKANYYTVLQEKPTDTLRNHGGAICHAPSDEYKAFCSNYERKELAVLTEVACLLNSTAQSITDSSLILF